MKKRQTSDESVGKQFRVSREPGYSFFACGHIWGLPSIVHRVTAVAIENHKPLPVVVRRMILSMLESENNEGSRILLDRLTCLHSGTPTHRIEVSYSFIKGHSIVTLFSMDLDFSREGYSSDHLARLCCSILCSVMTRPYLRRGRIRPTIGNTALTARSTATKQYWLTLLFIRYQWEFFFR